MSYARLSEGDVYLYHDSGLGLRCQACRFLPELRSKFFKTFAGAIAHVERHIAAGHKVPERTLRDLREDQALIGEDAGAGALDEDTDVVPDNSDVLKQILGEPSMDWLNGPPEAGSVARKLG